MLILKKYEKIRALIFVYIIQNVPLVNFQQNNVIHFVFVNKEIETSEILDDISELLEENPEGEFPLSKRILLIDNEQISLPLSTFGEILENFTFKPDGIVAKLFINGSDIVKKVNIELDSNYASQEDIDAKNITLGSSGIDPSKKIYEGDKIPNGGVSINISDFLKKHENLEIALNVFLEEGTEISVDLLSNPSITVELVIWLPLVFIAGDSSEIKFPEFEGLGDFLISLTESGVIESLKLQIGLNENPFKNGEFVIRDTSGGYIISCPITNTSVGFELTEGNVKYINNNKDTFAPEFSIKFNDGATLGIPKELKIMSVSMDAQLLYEITNIGGGEAE
jgi:hypothetical protein